MRELQVLPSGKVKVSKSQRRFIKLSKQVQELKSHIEQARKELETELIFFHGQLVPVKRKVNNALAECTQLFYGFHRKLPKSLTAREKKFLKEIILNTAKRILSENSRDERNPEIAAIYSEVSGKNFDEEMDEQLRVEREEFEQELREQGINLDLSDIDLQQNPEQFAQRLAEKMRGVAESLCENEQSSVEHKKTKKQLEKEKAHDLLLKRQQQGISTIYKQLVKAVHPDAELVPEVKREKEEFLKRVTVAYKNRDISDLLALELEWQEKAEDLGLSQISGSKNDEVLEILNTALSDQVHQLKLELELLPNNFRYMSIARFGQAIEEISENLRREFKELERESVFYAKEVAKLKGRAPVKSLKGALKQYGLESDSPSEAGVLGMMLALESIFE